LFKLFLVVMQRISVERKQQMKSPTKVTTADRHDAWNAQRDAFFLSASPSHHWLFERMTALVHHGGAGTTHTGLLHGCPTWICPFFGDQHFWGEMTYRAGLGPKPCPVQDLTLQTVIDSLKLLLNERTLQTAEAIKECMMKEDGVDGALQAFYKHLPVENMVCDVSLFRGEYRLAQVFCKECNLKMSKDVSDYIHSESSLKLKDHVTNGSIVPCCYSDWTLPPPQTTAGELMQGIGGFVQEFAKGVGGVVYYPIKGIYEDGLQGAANGIVSGVNDFVNHQITGSGVLYERFKGAVSILKKKNNWTNKKDDFHDIKYDPEAVNSEGHIPSLQEIKDELAHYSHFNKKVPFHMSHDCSERTMSWRMLRYQQGTGPETIETRNATAPERTPRLPPPVPVEENQFKKIATQIGEEVERIIRMSDDDTTESNSDPNTNLQISSPDRRELFVTPPPAPLPSADTTETLLPLLDSLSSSATTVYHTPKGELVLSPMTKPLPERTPMSDDIVPSKEKITEEEGIENRVPKRDNIIHQAIYSRKENLGKSDMSLEEENAEETKVVPAVFPTKALHQSPRNAEDSHIFLRSEWVTAFQEAKEALTLFQKINRHRNTR
jgi:hypothetical protein